MNAIGKTGAKNMLNAYWAVDQNNTLSAFSESTRGGRFYFSDGIQFTTLKGEYDDAVGIEYMILWDLATTKLKIDSCLMLNDDLNRMKARKESALERQLQHAKLQSQAKVAMDTTKRHVRNRKSTKTAAVVQLKDGIVAESIQESLAATTGKKLAPHLLPKEDDSSGVAKLRAKWMEAMEDHQVWEGPKVSDKSEQQLPIAPPSFGDMAWKTGFRTSSLMRIGKFRTPTGTQLTLIMPKWLVPSLQTRGAE